MGASLSCAGKDRAMKRSLLPSDGDSDGVVLLRVKQPDLLRMAESGNVDLFVRSLQQVPPRKVRRLVTSVTPRTSHSRRHGRSGNSAVHACAKYGRAECLEYLLRYCGASSVLEVRNASGSTPLLVACLAGQVDCVRLLLANGGNIQVRNSWDEGVVHLATQCKDEVRGLECLKLLLSNGANINAKCGMGWTALHWAAREHHHECLQLLIDAGCPLDTMDQIRVTALNEASREGDVRSVQALLAAGASPCFRDLGGNLALHEAVIGGHSRCIGLLLNANTSVNERGREWSTALHMAVEACDMDGVQVLLDGGADPYLTNSYDRNCFQLLSSRTPIELVYMLLERCAYLNRPTWLGAKSRALDAAGTFKTALPLQKLARMCIRTQVGDSCTKSVARLPLPQIVKDFILYQDSPPEDVMRAYSAAAAATDERDMWNELGLGPWRPAHPRPRR